MFVSYKDGATLHDSAGFQFNFHHNVISLAYNGFNDSMSCNNVISSAYNGFNESMACKNSVMGQLGDP